MNVLMLTQWYPNKRQPYFGIFVREHARAIVAAGHKVHVINISLHHSIGFSINTTSYTDKFDIMVTQCEINSVFKDVLFHLPTIQELILKRIIRKKSYSVQDIDVIHSHVIYPAGLWGHNLAKRLNVPHVITEHWSRLDKLSNGIYRNAAFRAYNSAKAILPVSHFLKQKITTIFPGLSEQKFRVVGNVVDPAIFNYHPIKKDQQMITFCAVATWQQKTTPDKLPELFIDALSSIQKKVTQPLQLTIIGGGNKVAELKKRCKQSSLNARFTGFIPKEQIAVELNKSDFFIHASTVETFSIVVAEALSSGLPVVCSDTGALPELVNSSNGIVCENTSDKWEKALLKIIETPFNKQQIASELQNRFGYEAIGNQITEVYLQALHL